MKDAFGGAYMLRVMLVFFVIFICLLTVAINFAKTFRIKNYIVNIIELNEKDGSLDDSIKTNIDDYLKSIGYNYSNNDKVKSSCAASYRTEYGACVVPVCSNDKCYYKVTAYIVMDFPLFNFGYAIPISGETKIVNL